MLVPMMETPPSGNLLTNFEDYSYSGAPTHLHLYLPAEAGTEAEKMSKTR